jgi:TolB-like protein/DNA-binding winged helix-turn-helix (wHTH) protein/Flp pilus assembly protein TadD
VKELEPQLFYEFGEFQLDVRRRILRSLRRGQPVNLTPKAVGTLVFLIEHAGQVVEKESLLSAIWPNVVVEEGNLTQTIHVLRRALGEHPEDHRFILTVPGRGYQFVAHVAQVSRPTGRSYRAIVIALASVLGVAALIYVWHLVRPLNGTESASSPVVTAELPARAVAILPFQDLSADQANRHLASGITASVSHRLAGVRGLTLIARTSASAFGDEPADAMEIGRRLNARFVVEGSVQSVGERLRVTAQLIDASTGGHVWSLRFDRKTEDIFAVEDEIAQRVTRALQLSLAESRNPFAQHGTDAYLLFLQGRALMETRRVADAELAIERLSHAIQAAPGFAAAYVELARAHLHHADILTLPDTAISKIAARQKAESLLSEALAIDRKLGEAYVLRAALRESKGDVVGAEADFRRGLALNPNDGPGHAFFADFLEREGKIDEALNAIDRARAIDPLNPRGHYFKGLLLLYHGAGTIEESEALFLQALSVAPEFHPALQRLGTIRKYSGRLAEAVKFSERAIAIDPQAQWLRVELSLLYLDLDDPDAARDVIADVADERAAAWLPVCLYEGDLGAAKEILRETDESELRQLDQLYPFILRAIRDQASEHGSRTDAPALLQSVARNSEFVFGAADPDVRRRMIAGRGTWYLDDVLVAAHWQKSIGQRAKAEASARAALERIAVDRKRREGAGSYAFDRERAMAFAILGQKDASIAALDRAISHRRLIRLWWYDSRREPAFKALQKDPRFWVIVARARTYVREQRELLEEMRRDGIVPRRAMKTSIAGPC